MSKGGGKKEEPVQEELIKPHLGPRGQDWRAWDYAQVKRGLKGKGYAPKGFYKRQRQQLQAGALEAYDDASFDFQSLNKNAWGDAKTQAFGQAQLGQSYGMLRDDIDQGILEQKASDRGLARATAADYAAGARNVASHTATAYNNQMMQMRATEMSQGNFYSNLLGGLGGGLGSAAAGMQYGQMMSGQQA
jgi:hypothetical protein